MEELRQAISAHEAELAKLKLELQLKQKEMAPSVDDHLQNHILLREDVARYGRQLILPELGVQGQLRLKQASVLIVGCGGLGCPAALYLASAGIGCLGLLDYDTVELGNLHRQVLHTEARVGLEKCDSAAAALNSMNGSVRCNTHHTALLSSNALEIVRPYDIVVDASDNVATRYLVNDTCVLLGKPLVSGSALRFEGQLTVYHHDGGPCYRCLFPQPPPPETVTNCSDGGVLGMVPGVIGVLQAIEVVKIATGLPSSFSQQMLLFDALSGSFRKIRLRPQQPSCAVCGDKPSITQLIDYVQFCGASATDKTKTLHLLKDSQRMTCQEYKALVDKNEDHLLLDVRPQVQFAICSLPGAVNIPLAELQSCSKDDLCKKVFCTEFSSRRIVVLCRQGNDSQVAVSLLQPALGATAVLHDVIGGIKSWAETVDADFPVY